MTFVKGKLSKGMGASFIALMPKKVGEVGVKDFRPISLIGRIYKIMAKVLAGKDENRGRAGIADRRQNAMKQMLRSKAARFETIIKKI